MIQLRVGCIGAGNMGGGLLLGLLDAGAIEAGRLSAVDLREELLAPLRARGVATGRALADAVGDRDLVILAVKPQASGPVLAELAPLLSPQQLVVSLMAGVTTEAIAGVLGRPQPVVRAMPQTLVRVGAAATAVCAGAHATPRHVEQVRALFDAVGTTVSVAESQMDSVTGLSGSGPAYIYAVIEALADAGVGEGLSREVALRLAAQTAAGAGRMVLESGLHPAVLRDQVTSPGGTTIEGLRVLEERGLRAALIGAVRAAARRARELG
ncbi:MAG: pyrroline-5-carboxylate reductase [Gemmatimonadota bacterium]